MDQVKLFFADLSTMFGFPPSVLGNVVGAILLLIVGYLLAKLFARLVRNFIKKTGLQDRVDAGSKGTSVDIGKMLGKLVYYLLMIFVLIAVLDVLGFNNSLRPLENLLEKVTDFLPNLLGAGVLAFAGYVFATLASELIAMAVRGVEGLSERFGLTDSVDWANLVRQLIFILIFVPLLIAAVDVLGLETLSAPLTAILEDVLSAIPKVLGAVAVLVVFYYLAKFVSGFVRNLLSGLNIDTFVKRMQLDTVVGNASVVSIASGFVFFLIVFSGILTASNVLEFGDLSVLLNELFELTLQVIFGLIILAFGNVLATFAHDAVLNSQSSSFLASIARYTVLGLFIAIALRTMGIADDIVNLAFGLTLGAIAVAFALSFGLGGREAAGKQMEAFLSKFRNELGNKK